MSIKYDDHTKEQIRVFVASRTKGHGGTAFTKYDLSESLLDKISSIKGEWAVVFNLEILYAVIFYKKVDPKKITFFEDCPNKKKIAEGWGCKTVPTSVLLNKNTLRKYMEENKNKFDVVIGNPPFQMVVGKSKVGIGTTLIKQFYEDLTKDGGILAMVSNTTFLGGGQKGLGYLFSENEVIDIQLNHKKHFRGVSIDIGSFIIRKSPSTSSIINIENDGSKMSIDTLLYQYEGTKGYIPRNVNATTLPILSKILAYNKDVFDFRASNNKSAKHKVGFWAGANTGIHARYLKITNNTNFTDKNIDHPCSLDKQYPEENIKAVFAGKLFHFVITMINGNQSDRRPANLSFFPKVDLDTKWTFDKLADEFSLTEEEKSVVLNWANTERKNVEWQD